MVPTRLAFSCKNLIIDVLDKGALPVNVGVNMRYSRVIIAKVALGIASEDEVFWVRKCGVESVACAGALKELTELAKLPSSYLCIDAHALIEAADTNRYIDGRDHMMGCTRCARIGQYIANMPSDKADPISLSA